ncbi:MAG TPA: AAA family ATPase, partial [Spirochaetales bacterium]|nr:AAA family ATPase [Spirochaetales bacterium]
PIEIKIPEGDKRSEYMQVMCDLNVLAFQTDATRVCTYIGSTPNGVSYPELGFNNQHHSQTHHNNDPEKMEKVAKITAFNIEQFAYMVKKMHGLREGEGTLLDNCIMMWGSGLEDGDWGKPVIGQPRATEALGMGTAIRARGYNLFVTGAPGTGRRTAVMRVLAERAPSLHGLKDYAYVYNFSEPQAPRALAFPSGSALSFKRDVHDLVENVKKLISMQSESGDFKKRKEEQVAVWEAEENSRLAAFEAELAADGFRVVQLQGEDGQTATDILPVRDGEPVSFDDLQSGDAPLPEAEFGSLRERYFGHMDRMRLLFVDLKRGRGKLETQLDRLRRDSIQPLIHAEAELLSSRHEGASVRAWIVALERDILHHLYLFQPADDAQERKPKR